MTFTALLLAVPMLCYGIAAVAYGVQGNWALAVVYTGYALANVGLIALDIGMTK